MVKEIIISVLYERERGQTDEVGRYQNYATVDEEGDGKSRVASEKEV